MNCIFEQRFIQRLDGPACLAIRRVLQGVRKDLGALTVALMGKTSVLEYAGDNHWLPAPTVIDSTVPTFLDVRVAGGRERRPAGAVRIRVPGGRLGVGLLVVGIHGLENTMVFDRMETAMEELEETLV